MGLLGTTFDFHGRAGGISMPGLDAIGEKMDKSKGPGSPIGGSSTSDGSDLELGSGVGKVSESAQDICKVIVSNIVASFITSMAESAGGERGRHPIGGRAITASSSTIGRQVAQLVCVAAKRANGGKKVTPPKKGDEDAGTTGTGDDTETPNPVAEDKPSRSDHVSSEVRKILDSISKTSRRLIEEIGTLGGVQARL